MARLGRPAKDLIVTAADRAQLESIARSQSLPAAVSCRAQMILATADGASNSAVAPLSSQPSDGDDVAQALSRAGYRRPAQ